MRLMKTYIIIILAFAFALFAFISISGCTGLSPQQDCDQYHDAYNKDYCYMRKASYEYMINPDNPSIALDICENDVEKFNNDCYHMIAVVAANQEMYKKKNDESYQVQINSLVDICKKIDRKSIKNDCLIDLASITHMNQSCQEIEENKILKLVSMDYQKEICYAKAKD